MIKYAIHRRGLLFGLVRFALVALCLCGLVACSVSLADSERPASAGVAAPAPPTAAVPAVAATPAAAPHDLTPLAQAEAVPAPLATAALPQPASTPAPVGAGGLPGTGFDQRITIVVLGVDNRPTEPLGRSDTMIVLTFDPQTGAAGMISLTRDLLVTIPGLPFRAKINTANFYGDLYKMPGGGPELLRKTASAFLGYPIDYWVRINFDGFRQIIDGIGGIDINVPTAINDPQFPDDNYGYDPLYIPAGLVHMDGTLALKYARTRHEDSDYGRVHRQQQVIRAVMDKMLRPENAGLLLKMPALALTFGRSIQTNLPVSKAITLIRLMDQMNQTDGIGLTSAVVDNSMGTIVTDSAWGWVLIPDMRKVHAAAARVFETRPPQRAANPAPAGPHG